MNNYESVQNALAHHGILGMKWGVRRFQDENGSLTSAGKKRYNDDIESAKSDLATSKSQYKNAKAEYNRATLGGTVYNRKAIDKLNKAAKKVTYSKEDVSAAKTKAKMSTQKKKSAHQSALEAKYKENGLTDDEAALAAYKRVQTEKIIAVTAGVTIAAAAAYVAYRHYDNTVDRVIKSGSTLQNISTNSNRGVADAFYSSGNRMDNTKYRGIYGTQLKGGGLLAGSNKIYETKIGVQSDLKVASRKSATNVLSELVRSDKSYAKDLETELTSMQGSMQLPKQKKVISDGLKSLRSGKVDAKVYEALNLSLSDHGSQEANNSSKVFYDRLKAKGYDAIKDINDTKYSGYKTSTPTIVFNGGAKTAVSSVRELGEAEINKSLKIGYADIIARGYAKQGAAFVAAAGGVKAISTVNQNQLNSEKVQAYRKKHPNSELSSKEIIRGNYS